MRGIALGALAALVAAAVTAGGAAAPTPTFAPRAGAAGREVSSNWAGYAAVGTGGSPAEFTDVTATWVQPSGSCTAGREDGAAFWVGLGGYGAGAQSLEQVGTSVECDGSGRAAVHSAWWEILPAPSVRVPLKLSPGDTVTAAVLVQGGRVTLSLKNVTRRTRFAKTVAAPAAVDLSSAEWVAEAPSTCGYVRCRVMPLTDFGAVGFSRAAAIGNGHAGTISDPAWTATPIELVASGDPAGGFFSGDVLGPGVGAVPGPLSADGRSFSVAWQQDVSPSA